MNRLVGFLASIALASCTTSMAGPWSAWTWRQPATVEEWKSFHPLAAEELNHCRACRGRIKSPCRSPIRVGYRDPDAVEVATCEAGARAWRKRMTSAFFSTHPDIDPQVRRYIEAGRLDPPIDAATGVEQARLLRAEDDSQAEAEARAALDREHREASRLAEVDQKLKEVGYEVAGADFGGRTIGCSDALELRAAYEYARVGDWRSFNELVDGTRCIVIPKGRLVVPVVQQAEYWRVTVGFWGPWVRASDLRKYRPE